MFLYLPMVWSDSLTDPLRPVSSCSVSTTTSTTSWDICLTRPPRSMLTHSAHVHLSASPTSVPLVWHDDITEMSLACFPVSSCVVEGFALFSPHHHSHLMVPPAASLTPCSDHCFCKSLCEFDADTAIFNSLLLFSFLQEWGNTHQFLSLTWLTT